MELNIKTAIPVEWGVDFNPGDGIFHPEGFNSGNRLCDKA
jgi:hypothetical protein